MRGIDVFYQLCYFLSLNARNAYIQGRREYVLTNKFISCHSFNYRQFHDRISDTNIKQTELFPNQSNLRYNLFLLPSVSS
jgi:hypothetical protein